MYMTLYDFYTLGAEEQRKTVQGKGVYLMNRVEEGVEILLFALDGFYIEVCYDAITKTVEPVRVFYTTELLDPYLKQINLSTDF